MSCTAPLSPLTITSFYEKFRAAISQHYGSSEAGAVTFQLPADVLSFPGSVGKPMSGVTVRIVDEADVSLPEFKTGEIIVAGDAVATQYVMGEPEGRSLLSEGTYRTGDIGYMDANGFLFVTGRADQLINVGGLKVSPAEIVGVLESWEKVKEAAVKGIVNRLGTTIVCAFVAVREKLTEQDVIDFCRARLADYKVPRRVIFVTQLPRTTTGKVMISALDSMYIET
jgi:long-chain acyl-CoA synthetase